MTSLLGRLLPLFIGARRVEDLFTEAVARLFERRPDLCLSWLDELGLITTATEEGHRHVRVSTQKSFLALDEHDIGSRPDLILEVHHAVENVELDGPKEIVMIESKIGSWEGQDQLKRYAEHLDKMAGTRRTLVYITRAYDPKDGKAVLACVDERLGFKQLRWHDFYRFLEGVEKDAVVEEVAAFMEEQGMARTYRFSATDLMALSGVPRAFEIIDETFEGEVRAELEGFAGNKISERRDYTLAQVRGLQRYIMLAPLHPSFGLYAYVGFQLSAVGGYPMVFFVLESPPTNAAEKKTSLSAMRQMANRGGWEGHNLDEVTAFSAVERRRSLADLLFEEDHVAAVKRFFIESIHQLRDELTAFKQEHSEFPWGQRMTFHERSAPQG